MANQKITIEMPRWVAAVYVGSAVAVMPWTIFLDQYLPATHVFRHWDIAWVGLDVGLILAMFTAGVLIYRKSVWAVLAAVTTGSLLLVDAWFDVNGAHHGLELAEALAEAIFLELPLAFASYYFAGKVISSTDIK